MFTVRTHNTKICVEGNRFLLIGFPVSGCWSILALNSSFPQGTELPLLPQNCKPKPYPQVSHYCLSVLLELKPAMQTGCHPLWGVHLCVLELPSSHCTAALFLRGCGALPDHSRWLCNGSSICREFPSSCFCVMLRVSVCY